MRLKLFPALEVMLRLLVTLIVSISIEPTLPKQVGCGGAVGALGFFLL